MKTARIFNNGNSQAVRLPKAFRFEGTEVEIERRGRDLVEPPERRDGRRDHVRGGQGQEKNEQ